MRDGRFRPEYVAGGVVSGRWATRGGGALQIPKAVRAAVRADPGWRLVVADAAQLEPRVLAALSGDAALAPGGRTTSTRPSRSGTFGGDRAKAKLALLGAMYGQTSGGAGAAAGGAAAPLPRGAGLRRGRRPRRRGGQARPVAPGADLPSPARRAGRRRSRVRGGGRARGRFTRNFVVQATAAEWALVLLAELRLLLRASGARRGWCSSSTTRY